MVLEQVAMLGRTVEIPAPTVGVQLLSMLQSAEFSDLQLSAVRTYCTECLMHSLCCTLCGFDVLISLAVPHVRYCSSRLAQSGAL